MIIIYQEIIDPLRNLIVKASLTNEDVMECKTAIFHIVEMEQRNEGLPGINPSGGTRVKAYKR